MCMAPNDGSGVRVGRKAGATAPPPPPHEGGDQLMGGCNPPVATGGGGGGGGGQQIHTPPHKDRPPDDDISVAATPPKHPNGTTTPLVGRVHTRRSSPEETSPGKQLEVTNNHHLPHRRRRLANTVGHVRKRSGEDDSLGLNHSVVGAGMERRSKVARGPTPMNSPPTGVNGVKRLNGCVINGIVNGESKTAALLDRLAGLTGADEVMMMGAEKRGGRGGHLNNHHHTRNNNHHHPHHNNHVHNNHNHHHISSSGNNGLIKEVLQNGVEHLLLEKNGIKKALNGTYVVAPPRTSPVNGTANTNHNNNNTNGNTNNSPGAPPKRVNGVLTRLGHPGTRTHDLRRGVVNGSSNNNSKVNNHVNHYHLNHHSHRPPSPHTNNNLEPTTTLLPPTPITKVMDNTDNNSSSCPPVGHPPSPPISPTDLTSLSSSSSSPIPSPSCSSTTIDVDTANRATQGLLILPNPPPPSQGLTTFNCDAGLTPPTPSPNATPKYNNNITNHHRHHDHNSHPAPLSPTSTRCSAKSSPPPAHNKSKSLNNTINTTISSGLGSSSAPSSAPSSGTSTPTPTTTPVVRFPPPKKKEPSDVCRWRDCNATLDPTASLLEHIQAVHVEGQLEAESFRCLWVGCKVYDKASCSVSWLERHVLTHGGHKPFKCIVDGCGQRFSSQTALGRHVNHHFNSTSTTPSPRPPSQPSPSKLIRKNGRKCRYRKKPWSDSRAKVPVPARMFDVFDVGVMERVRWRLMCVTQVQTGGVPQAPNNSITVKPQVLARRGSSKGGTEVLVRWNPPGVLADEWIPLENVESSRNIPLEKLSPEAKQTVSQLCYPSKAPPQKHRRKRPAHPKAVSLIDGSKQV